MARFFATNPTQDEYAAWLKQQAYKSAGGGLEGALVSLLGGLIINIATTRDDFLLFSIYETDLGDGDKLRALGVLRHFFPIATARKPRPPHVVAEDTNGHFHPEDGYTWVNPSVAGDLRVKWTPKRLSSAHPHVVAADQEGRWIPEDGYTWIINPPVSGDFRVKWTPGRFSSVYPHVVAANEEGRWQPEKGYAWFSNPPSGDFRVRPIVTTP